MDFTSYESVNSHELTKTPAHKLLKKVHLIVPRGIFPLFFELISLTNYTKYRLESVL